MKISIIIPTYNEANAVRNVLDQLIHGKYHQKYEIIFVNDGSIDKTADIIKEYPVILYNHHVNKGYGASIKTGIGKSKGDKIIILDSDGQHDPNYIDEIVTLLNQYDMVIGNRDEKSYQVKSRQAGKKLIRFVGEYLLEQKLPDYNSGFRGFDKKLINKMLHILPNGFSFSTTSTLAFIKEGYSVGVFPIKVNKRVGGKSNVKMMKDGSKTMLLLFRIIMLFNPLRIFFPTSLFFLSIGMSWGVYGIIVANRLPNSSIIILFFGVILFFIGLIADQLAMLNRKSI